MDRNLPWMFVFTGMGLAAIVEFMKIPSLPFAVGLYLPVSLSVPIMVGGLLRGVLEKTRKGDVVKTSRERGVLFGSGLVAGDATIGVLIALFVYGREKIEWLAAVKSPLFGELPYSGAVSVLMFSIMTYLLWRVVTSKRA